MQHIPLVSFAMNLARCLSGQIRAGERRAEGAVILMYHGIIQEERIQGLERYFLTSKMFQNHLRHLHRRANVISMDELMQTLSQGGRIDPRSVVITMDDALISQVTCAAELLDGFKFPWTLAVPAGLIGTGRSIWTYELGFAMLLWKGALFPLPWGGAIALGSMLINERERLLGRVKSYLISEMSSRDRMEYIENMLEIYGRSRFAEEFHRYGIFEIADWNQLNALKSSGRVEFIAHGYSHQPINHTLSEAVLAEEVVGSKELLYERLGCAVKGFALPGGVLDRRCLKMIEREGYQYCLTSESARIKTGQTPLAMPRFDGEYPLNILRQHLLRSAGK